MNYVFLFNLQSFNVWPQLKKQSFNLLFTQKIPSLEAFLQNSSSNKNLLRPNYFRQTKLLLIHPSIHRTWLLASSVISHQVDEKLIFHSIDPIRDPFCADATKKNNISRLQTSTTANVLQSSGLFLRISSLCQYWPERGAHTPSGRVLPVQNGHDWQSTERRTYLQQC